MGGGGERNKGGEMKDYPVILLLVFPVRKGDGVPMVQRERRDGGDLHRREKRMEGGGKVGTVSRGKRRRGRKGKKTVDGQYFVADVI